MWLSISNQQHSNQIQTCHNFLALAVSLVSTSKKRQRININKLTATKALSVRTSIAGKIPLSTELDNTKS